MSGYTSRNPLTHVATDADGTTHSEVAQLGRFTDHIGRLPAFVGLAKATGGYYVEAGETPLTPQAAMAKADLNFTMQFEEITSNVITDTGVTRVDYLERGAVALYGDDRAIGMGTVGSTYQFVQNQQVMDLAQKVILGEGGANVAAIGAYGEPIGSQTYMAFKLPEGLTVAGEDPYDMYLTILNSHSGESALSALVAPIRIACTNMIPATFGKGAPNRYKLRHSGDVELKADRVRQALEIAFKWTEKWQIAADRLLHTPMSEDRLETFLHKVLPTPGDAGKVSERNWATRRIELRQIITQSPTNAFGRGTAYAVFQGVVELDNHFHNFKVARDEKLSTAKARDFGRILDGVGEGERRSQRALSLLLA